MEYEQRFIWGATAAMLRNLYQRLYAAEVANPATGLSVANAEWFQKPETQAVFACLNREGFEARVVGGAVRNTILDEPVREVDFATTSRPEDTVRLACAGGHQDCAHRDQPRHCDTDCSRYAVRGHDATPGC